MKSMMLTWFSTKIVKSAGIFMFLVCLEGKINDILNLLLKQNIALIEKFTVSLRIIKKNWKIFTTFN